MQILCAALIQYTFVERLSCGLEYISAGKFGLYGHNVYEDDVTHGARGLKVSPVPGTVLCSALHILCFNPQNDLARWPSLLTFWRKGS